MSIVTVSTGLAALLNAPGITTQTEACAAFIAAMGSNRRVIALRNGIPFRDCTLSGAMRSANGSITGFGVASTSTVSSAADLATGVCVLRITGGGHALEGTLGLPGSGSTFIMGENPTSTNGLAVSGVAIPLRLDLPLGVAVTPIDPPPTPTDPSDAQFSITKVDWTSGVAGAEQTIYFDEDGGDIVWEDAERAADTGAIPYRRSTQTFIHGTGGDALEIGFHLFQLPAKCNDETNAPVYQVMGVMKPYNRWAQYPFMATYNATTDSTFLKPCKYIVKKAGVPVGVLEMYRDGLPINDPSLGQTRNFTTVFRPLVHTKMALYWCSHRLKLADKARKYHNGMVKESAIRPKLVHAFDSANAVMPCFGTLRNQYNGYNHLMYMPPWPYSTDMDGQYPATDPNAPPQFPYYDPSGNRTNGAFRGFAATGIMYEPGSPSGHDWYPSPGGVRFDRYFVPSQLTMYVTDPTGVRAQGNIPYRVICDEYGKAYFNHGHHDVTNVRLLETLSFDDVASGKYAYTYGYYTPQGPVLVPGGTATHIDTKTIMNGAEWGPTDKDGRHHYHGWNVDNQHAYCSPGWYALMFNSVTHMVSAKMRFNATMMSSAGWGSPTATAAGDDGYTLKRQHAWRVLHLATMWKLATPHPLGVSRTKIVPRWVEELEFFHDTIVVPTTDPTHPQYNDIYFACLRNLGVPGTRVVSGNTHFIEATTDSKLLYNAGVLGFMKTTGSYDYMRAQSVKCQKSIDLIRDSIAKYTVTKMLATKGRAEGLTASLTAPVPLATSLVAPADWYAWASVFAPVDGAKDLITNADGSPLPPYERSGYQHLWVQAIFQFQTHFPEFNFPGVAEACSITQEMENRWNARVAAGTHGDFNYRHPAAGIQATPAL